MTGGNTANKLGATEAGLDRVHPGLSTAIDIAGDHALVIGDQVLGTGSLLAMAIAMALSSVPITATIVILLSPQRRRSSLPFLAGWVLTLGVVPLAAAAGILAMPLSRRERSQFAAAAVIVVGAALVIGAIVTWRRSQTRAPTLGRATGAPRIVRAGRLLRDCDPDGIASQGDAARYRSGAGPRCGVADIRQKRARPRVVRSPVRFDGGSTDCVHARFAALHGAATGDLACEVVPKRAEGHRVGDDDDRPGAGGCGVVAALDDFAARGQALRRVHSARTRRDAKPVEP